MSTDEVWANLDNLPWASAPRVAKNLLRLIFLKYATTRQNLSLGGPQETKLRLGDLWAVYGPQSTDCKTQQRIDFLKQDEAVASVLRETEHQNQLGLVGSEETLSMDRAIQILDCIDDEPETIQRLFRDALWRLSENSKLFGTLLTPLSLGRLIVEIAAPDEGESIGDPFCGTGSLLIQAYTSRGEVGDLLGQESNAEILEICRMNLEVHGVANPRLGLGDSMRSPPLSDDRQLLTHDVIVTDPTLGRVEWGQPEASADPWNRFRWGLPSKSRWGWAVASHILSTLNEGGRAVMTAPPGLLFRGDQEALIRRKILQENLVEGVILLPGRVFRPSSVPISLLVFNKAKPSDETLFIDARKVKSSRGSMDIERIVSAWKDPEDHKDLARLVGFREIEAQSFSLDVGRYVRDEPAHEDVDLSPLWSELAVVSDELDRTWNELASSLSKCSHRPSHSG